MLDDHQAAFGVSHGWGWAHGMAKHSCSKSPHWASPIHRTPGLWRTHPTAPCAAPNHLTFLFPLGCTRRTSLSFLAQVVRYRNAWAGFFSPHPCCELASGFGLYLCQINWQKNATKLMAEFELGLTLGLSSADLHNKVHVLCTWFFFLKSEPSHLVQVDLYLPILCFPPEVTSWVLKADL